MQARVITTDAKPGAACVSPTLHPSLPHNTTSPMQQLAGSSAAGCDQRPAKDSCRLCSARSTHTCLVC